MSHAIINATVIIRLKAYPSYTEEGDDYKPWGEVKEDAVDALVGRRVVDGKPSFWEWLTGWYDYEPEVTKIVSSETVEEVFDGE